MHGYQSVVMLGVHASITIPFISSPASITLSLLMILPSYHYNYKDLFYAVFMIFKDA